MGAEDVGHFEPYLSDSVEVVAEALREWQRNLGGGLAPTTLWIDRAEEPARIAVDALVKAGLI